MDPQFDRYNPHRRQFDPIVDSIVEQAYAIVRQNGYGELRTAHVLFCALNEPSTVEILKMFSVDGDELRRIRETCSKCFPTDHRYFDPSHPTAQSFGCGKALDHAFDESIRRDRRDPIGVPHLLAGLARESDEIAGVLLRQRGVTLDRLRKWIDGGCQPDRTRRTTARRRSDGATTALAAMRSQIAVQTARIEQLESKLTSVQEQVLALAKSAR